MTEIFLQLDAKDPIDNNPVLVQMDVLSPSRRQAIIWINDGLVYSFVAKNICDRGFRAN